MPVVGYRTNMPRAMERASPFPNKSLRLERPRFLSRVQSKRLPKRSFRSSQTNAWGTGEVCVPNGCEEESAPAFHVTRFLLWKKGYWIFRLVDTHQGIATSRCRYVGKEVENTTIKCQAVASKSQIQRSFSCAREPQVTCCAYLQNNKSCSPPSRRPQGTYIYLDNSKKKPRTTYSNSSPRKRNVHKKPSQHQPQTPSIKYSTGSPSLQ